MCTTDHLNPIKQDVEDGDRLRVYDYGDMLCVGRVPRAAPRPPRARQPATTTPTTTTTPSSPHAPSPPPTPSFNYGMIPQTYEDPTVDCPHSGLRGDDDPLDIIDLGHKQHPVGKVVRVRVLGILGMIDDGQTDWKVLGISTSDPLADRVHTLADAEREMPGAVRAATLWLRRYKVLKKGTENTFLYEGVCRAFPWRIPRHAAAPARPRGRGYRHPFTPQPEHSTQPNRGRGLCNANHRGDARRVGEDAAARRGGGGKGRRRGRGAGAGRELHRQGA